MQYLVFFGSTLCEIASWIFIAAAGYASSRYDHGDGAVITLATMGIFFSVCDKILMVWGLSWR